jgi:predicted AlkP superfamily pyrophosphatase or phosphodiesterase
MKRAVARISLLAIAACLGVSACHPKDTPPRNVILCSWDGLDRSVLEELLAGDRLPNLAALIGEGSLQKIEVLGHATMTKPSHAEMLTGLGPKDTGVVSNDDYRPIPEGYTIFERVQKRLGGRDRIRTIMVTGKLAHVGGRGPQEIRDEELKSTGKEQVTERPGDRMGEPYLLTKRHLDVFDAAHRDAPDVGALALRYLEQHHSPRVLAFIHFRDTDHQGHLHGSNSEEYRRGAVACDEWLGRIVAWLKARDLYAETLIYVTADHGFDKNARTHDEAPHSWLATNDRLVTHGGIVADIPATILARFGVDVGRLAPRLIGRPLTGP